LRSFQLLYSFEIIAFDVKSIAEAIARVFDAVIIANPKIPNERILEKSKYFSKNVLSFSAIGRLVVL